MKYVCMYVCKILAPFIITVAVLLPSPALAADNITYLSGNITLTVDLEDITTALTAQNENLSDFNALADEYAGQMFLLIIMAFFVIITMIQQHPYWRFALDLMTCCLLVYVATTWINDYLAVSMILIFFGLCFLSNALMFAIGDSGASRGWSEVKSWFNRSGQ